MKLFWLFLCLSACTTATTISMTSQRFQTPSTEGGFLSGAAGAAVGGGVSVSPVPNLSAPQANSSAQIKTPSSWGALGFDATLLGRLSLLPFLDAVVQGNQLGLKLQILGVGTPEGWKSSVQFLTSTVVDYTTISGDNSLTAKVSNQDMGWSLGYTLPMNLTPYFSVGRRNYNASENLDQAGVWTRWQDQGFQNFFSLGISLVGELYFTGLELSYVETGWSTTSTYYQTSLGGVFGFRW